MKTIPEKPFRVCYILTDTRNVVEYRQFYFLVG